MKEIKRKKIRSIREINADICSLNIEISEKWRYFFGEMREWEERRNFLFDEIYAKKNKVNELMKERGSLLVK